MTSFLQHSLPSQRSSEKVGKIDSTGSLSLSQNLHILEGKKTCSKRNNYNYYYSVFGRC